MHMSYIADSPDYMCLRQKDRKDLLSFFITLRVLRDLRG